MSDAPARPTLRLLFCPLPSPGQAAGLSDSAAGRLSPDDLAHIQRFTAPGAAAARGLARALLVLACRPPLEALPATLRKTPAGAPFFPHSRAALSFSYSQDAAVCALGFGPPGLRLGVDLESLASPPPAGRAFMPAERIRHPGEALRRWTVKEALLKAWGAGLAFDPARIHAGRCGQRRGRQTAPISGAPPLLWQSLPLPGHWCGLALSHPLPLRVFCLTPADVWRTLRKLGN